MVSFELGKESKKDVFPSGHERETKKNSSPDVYENFLESRFYDAFIIFVCKK